MTRKHGRLFPPGVGVGVVWVEPKEVSPLTERAMLRDLREGFMQYVDEKILEAAKRMFWNQHNVMHDHEENWQKCEHQSLFLENARIAFEVFESMDPPSTRQGYPESGGAHAPPE